MRKKSVFYPKQKGTKSSDVDLKCNVFSLEDAVVYVAISKISGLLTIAKQASNFIAPRIHRGFMPQRSQRQQCLFVDPFLVECVIVYCYLCSYFTSKFDNIHGVQALHLLPFSTTSIPMVVVVMSNPSFIESSMLFSQSKLVIYVQDISTIITKAWCVVLVVLQIAFVPWFFFI